MGFIERLHEEMTRGPIAAALAVRETVVADTASAAAIADNAELDVNARIAALLAIAIAAQDGVRVPAAALAALEDDVFLDAVLAAGASSAVTGILAAAGDQVSDGLRRYLALRLSAADASGVHIAVLLLSVGDIEGAVRAATPGFTRATHDPDERVLLALALIALDWLQSEPAFMQRLAHALPAGVRTQLTRAVRTLAPGDHGLVTLLDG
jgi:hypothetical protein